MTRVLLALILLATLTMPARAQDANSTAVIAFMTERGFSFDDKTKQFGKGGNTAGWLGALTEWVMTTPQLAPPWPRPRPPN